MDQKKNRVVEILELVERPLFLLHSHSPNRRIDFPEHSDTSARRPRSPWRMDICIFAPSTKAHHKMTELIRSIPPQRVGLGRTARQSRTCYASAHQCQVTCPPQTSLIRIYIFLS